MDPAIEHKDFSPPRQPVQWRGLVLAVIANALLLVGLAATLQWKRAPASENETQVMGAPAAQPPAQEQAAPAPQPQGQASQQQQRARPRR